MAIFRQNNFDKLAVQYSVSIKTIKPNKAYRYDF